MSFSDDFTAQWASFTDYLISCLIKDSASVKANPYATASSVYKNEILRWELDGQYNAEWLKELKKADPTVAARFSEELHGFQFRKVEAPSSSNAMNYILLGGGAVIGVGAGLVFNLGVFPTIAAGAVLAILGGFAGFRISDNKKKSVASSEMDAYKKQLKDLGDRLTGIVEQANGEESFGL